MFTIYHNPRCSKSRQTLSLLNDAGVDVTVIEYLEAAPTLDELKEILVKLGFKNPRDLMRTKETLYKELALGRDELSDDQLLEAMILNPKLIERPIVICGEKAVLGRPPENVNELLI